MTANTTKIAGTLSTDAADGKVGQCTAHGVGALVLSGTFTGTVALQCAPTGTTNWQASPRNTSAATALTATAVGAHTFEAVPGLDYRVMFTTASSGNPVYSLILPQ